MQFYKSVVPLHISDLPSLNRKGERIYLRERVVDDEYMRIDEVRNSLFALGDFKDFLIKHGNYAFKLIKEECIAYKEKYANKIDRKPYLRELVQSIDIEAMEERFQAICFELGIEKKTVRMQSCVLC